MRENKELKKKIAKMESVDHADEDPEEVTLYNTDGEEITIEEWEERVVRKAKEARAARLEAKHHNTLPLACLNRIKRRKKSTIYCNSLSTRLYCLTLVGMVVPSTLVILLNL
jgi:hypothetical protein